MLSNRCIGLIVGLFCCSLGVVGQTPTPAERLAAGRALYYLPASKGLMSFHCTVAVDWPVLLTHMTGKVIPPSDPNVQYLQAAKLSLDDDLNGKGTFTWSDPGTPSPDQVARAKTFRDGIGQMMQGFLQSWNSFATGAFIPRPDSSVTVTAAGDGLETHIATGNLTVDQHYDREVMLEQTHVATPEIDNVTTPTFVNTADGRLISSIKTVNRQPPLSPPLEVTSSITYATVSGFRIPSRLEVDRAGAVFDFDFKDCTVRRMPDAPATP